MDMKRLVTKYFDEIQIEDTDYVPWDDAVHDAAYLSLNLPTAVIEQYQKIQGINKMPDAAEFWHKTELSERLANSGKYHGQGHEPLEDILEFLDGEVQAHWQTITDTRIRLEVYEIPRVYDD